MTRLAPVLKQRFFTTDGIPLAGGKLYSYAAGTVTPLVTYADETGSTTNANPVVLDANGEADVYLGTAQYKFILQNSLDVTQWTKDNVNGNLTTAIDGIDGKSLRSGTTAPGGGDGNDGDFYIRTTTNYLYGPKASGTWPAGVSIVGPTGDTGATGSTGDTGATGSSGVIWRSGSGVPADALGANGDFYLDTATSDVYLKASGAYSLNTNIKGATGATGATGDAGTNGLGVPAGGATGQVLSKIDAIDNNTEWSTPNAAHSGLSGLTTGDDHTHYALLAGRAGGQIVKGGTASGDDLTLQSTNHATKGTITAGIIEVDEVNNRVGIGMAGAAPSHRAHFRAGADDYAHGFAFDHVSGGANSLWRIYPDLNGSFSIYNPAQATTVFNISATAQQLRLGEGGADGGAVNIRSQSGQTAHHTLVLKKLGSQTGDALRYYDTNGSTVLAKIDVAGAATFSGVTSSSNLITGYATTASAAGTTTLVVGSKQIQYFTGSTTQTVVLPVTSTLVLGQQFLIVNRSSGVVTVQSSGANSIQAMAANTQLLATVILTSGTDAASWDAVYASNALASGGGATTSTEWAAFTPTTTGFGTPTSVSFFWRRVGDTMHVKGHMVTGTITAATGSILLPDSKTIDTAKVELASTSGAVGPVVGNFYQTAASASGPMVLMTTDSTTLVYTGNFYGVANFRQNPNFNTVGYSTTGLHINFSVPISGWTNSN